MSMLEKRTMEELNRLSVEEFKSAGKIPIVIVLDNIRSQNNIGSVFRTADAFRLEAIYLCGITASPPHREIHKTALGSTETVDWKYFRDTGEAVTFLKSENYNVYAVEQVHNSILLPDFVADPAKKTALVFGNEVQGVDESVIEKCQAVIEIPQFGTKHSINISVSVGIVIWDLISKHNFYNYL